MISVINGFLANFYVTLVVTLSFGQDKVKLLSSGGNRLAFIKFNGQGSNFRNWFHNSRILRTSWTDISPSGSYNYFSIDNSTSQRKNGVAFLCGLGCDFKFMRSQTLLQSSMSTGEWELVFHAPSGKGENVLAAWKSIHGNCDLMSGCCPCYMKDGCLPNNAKLETFRTSTKILRSPYLDFWGCLNIKKVKLELSTGGNRLAFIEFNGQGSNYMNWFHNSRIMRTSWTDMSPSGSYNVFSIDEEARIGRHFFINKGYSGCVKDSGWFVVVDTTSTQPCQYDKRKPFPQFLYSRNGRINNWNDMKYGTADVLNIYIQRGQ